jgi:hypothetical protein
VNDTRLEPPVREVLDELRGVYEPGGWTVTASHIGPFLEFTFTNPLSPVKSTVQFDADISATDLRRRVSDDISNAPEFLRLQSVEPPKRRRRLLGGLRWAAAIYEWPDDVFEEIIDTLRGLRVLSVDEHKWLKTIGFDVLPTNGRDELLERIRRERHKA